MRWIIYLLCLTALAAAQEPALDDARVQLSYKELKALIEAAKVKPPEVSPVESSILSARYDVQWREGTAAGVADFEVQTFRDGPQVVPLTGDGLIIESVEPKDATVVLRDGHYALAVEGKQKSKVTLRFTLPVRQTEESLAIECAISPAVTASVQIRDIPKGRHVAVDKALRVEATGDAEKWQLGRSALLRIALRDEPKPLPPPIVMPAVIGEATSDMRVVADGAFSNRMTWRIRHEGQLTWKLDLPGDMQVIAARVDGKPASPSRLDAKTLEFRLPESPQGDTSVVELIYTGKSKALDPSRGELSLALPATSLLVEKLQWRVTLPATYQTTVTQGNMEVLTAKTAGEISLGKEFCQAEAPAVRLAYEVPPSITAPAVIREAASEMRVVNDGAFFNKMTWRIRHQAALVWKLALPEEYQLVSSRVGEQPASPSRVDAKTIEFRLPEPAKGETVVELSYTGKGKAFDPVRGELALTLPATPLLVESLAWRVAMPAIYETVAAQGNVDFLPGNSPGDIRLSKELCQGDAPAVRLFYQKPETTKKP